MYIEYNDPDEANDSDSSINGHPYIIVDESDSEYIFLGEFSSTYRNINGIRQPLPSKIYRILEKGRPEKTETGLKKLIVCEEISLDIYNIGLIGSVALKISLKQSESEIGDSCEESDSVEENRPGILKYRFPENSDEERYPNY